MFTTFTDQATTKFASFLKTRTTENADFGSSGNEAVVLESNLTKLALGPQQDHKPMQRLQSHQLADALLMVVESSSSSFRLFPTVGSMIHTLCLGRVHPSFLNNWTEHAHRVALHRLQLEGLSRKACREFAKCIPKLATLIAVAITNIKDNTGDGAAQRWILRGLKHNGSICEILLDKKDGTCDFGPSDLRLMSAFRTRNRCLGAMLATPPIPKSAHCNDQSVDTRTGTATLESVKKAVRIELFPTLLGEAVQAPGTSFTMVILFSSPSTSKQRS